MVNENPEIPIVVKDNDHGSEESLTLAVYVGLKGCSQQTARQNLQMITTNLNQRFPENKHYVLPSYSTRGDVRIECLDARILNGVEGQRMILRLDSLNARVDEFLEKEE